MALAAGTIEGELLVVECDEAAAVVRFLQNITLQCPQHHTAADPQFYTENELCQASLYEDSLLLKYHNTFGGNIPGIL